MNLLNELKQEITKYSITNEVFIPRYIYLRMGQIFDFDAHYLFVKYEDMPKLLARKMDMTNITEYTLVCSTFAYLYQDILHEFGYNTLIKEEQHGLRKHYYVLVKTSKYLLKADVTGLNFDLSSIKFGLPTKDFYILNTLDKGKKIINKIDKEINYQKEINTEEILKLIRQELLAKNLKRETYIEEVIKIVTLIMNIKRENVNFVSGRDFIIYLFNYFLLDNTYLKTYSLYNLEQDKYIALITLKSQDNYRYFVYQKDDYYTLKPITEEEKRALFLNYDFPKTYKLQKH